MSIKFFPLLLLLCGKKVKIRILHFRRILIFYMLFWAWIFRFLRLFR